LTHPTSASAAAPAPAPRGGWGGGGGGAPGGGRGPALVVVYNGFGTEARARLWGRTLHDRGLGPARPGESRWKKLERIVGELHSDELRNASLTVKVLGKSYPVKSDSEGLFALDLPGPLPVGLHDVDARLEQRPFRTEAGRLLVAPRKPGVAVVSDIDDTILQTGVTDKATMIRRLLSSNAHDLRTYPQAPGLYRIWARRGYPIVFVSGSPVNLYSRITQFLALRGFPASALLLKNPGLEKGADSLFEQRNYKLRRIREVQSLLPGYRLLLVGDSGEQDPEIYAEVRRSRGADVLCSMIHRVTSEAAGAPRLQQHLVFDSYMQLARALFERRQLTAAELKELQAGAARSSK
jgi:phosphatidate phosphatase APP1